MPDSILSESTLVMVETSNPVSSQSEGNQSLLRAARSGNVGKITEQLNSNVDLNAVNTNGLNALHLATKEGHQQIVRLLLDHGVILDAKTKKGNTALHIASLAGKTNIVRLLVERGANVNARAQNGFTPLYMAAQENHKDIVEYLLDNGADQELPTDDGFTPLAIALQQKHDGIVTMLLDRDIGNKGRMPALHISAKKNDLHSATMLLANADVDVNHTSSSGFTPLHIAAHYGNVKIARLLISNRADVNFNAKNNITPLHVAAKWGHLEMVKLLLEQGANYDSGTRDGLTPLHCASRTGHSNVAEHLISSGAGINVKTKNGLSPLHVAAQGDHAEIAKLLLKSGALPDDVTIDSLTPLHIAAHCGHLSVANVLIGKHCDVNARALNGFMPLHIACKKMKVKVVELLLKHGALVEATTQTGFSPLHVASFVGCTQAVSLLIQRGANVNQTTVRGETPLYLAIRGRHVDTVKFLVKHSASVNAELTDRRTALHAAIQMSEPEIVKCLLDAGADINRETRGNYTPLHMAIRDGNMEIISQLLDKSALVDAKTKRGNTALHIAAKYGRTEVMEMLLRNHPTDVNALSASGLTPLHIAVNYEFPEIVNLLLANKADVNMCTKSGLSPLHLAAKLERPDIALLLLKAGATVDVQSANGYTALHIAAKEQRLQLAKVLLEDYAANSSAQSNDGLTPLHLAARSNSQEMVKLLLDNGANFNVTSSIHFTPMHEACYHGKIDVVRLLLQRLGDQGSDVLSDALKSRTLMGNTPLHLAAEKGHHQLIDAMLLCDANPNLRNRQGWTAAQVAKKQNHQDAFLALSNVTNYISDWDVPSLDGAGEDGISAGDSAVVDGSMAPEHSIEAFDFCLIESDDESDQLLSTPVTMRRTSTQQTRPLVREKTLVSSPSYELVCAQLEYTHSHKGEPIFRISARDSAMEEHPTFSPEPAADLNLVPTSAEPDMSGVTPVSVTEAEFEPENVQPSRNPIKTGFLVSFMADARGVFVEAQRKPDLRLMIPPTSINCPTRLIIRLLSPDRVVNLPTLNDGDAFACRIMEMSPSRFHFSTPILLEVPHFASLQGRDREIVVFRSDNGETWKAHPIDATDQAIRDSLGLSFEELEPSQIVKQRRIQRILTNDIPQYFALISRFRQDISFVGPEGGVISSTVAQKVQAVFPEGALQKKIKVGIEAQVIPRNLIENLAGDKVAFSPIVTIEPRRRKFHKPITITIPLPRIPSKETGKETVANPANLRLLCSITAGSLPATWEDITGATVLARQKDCVSFTTTVSARLWLVDAPGLHDVSELAGRIYQESIIPPYIGQFAVYGRLPEDRIALESLETDVGNRLRRVLQPSDAEIRCVCLFDKDYQNSLESQEKFNLLAISPPVELFDSKYYSVDTVGDISSYPAHARQLKFRVQAFRENRLTYPVRVRQPKGSKSGPTGSVNFRQYLERSGLSSKTYSSPVTTLTIEFPVDIFPTIEHIEEEGPPKDLAILSEVIGPDWRKLATELHIAKELVDGVVKEPLPDSLTEREADVLKCDRLLMIWLHKCSASPLRSNSAMRDTLSAALVKIGRSDVAVPGILTSELTKTSREGEIHISTSTTPNIVLAAVPMTQEPKSNVPAALHLTPLLEEVKEVKHYEIFSTNLAPPTEIEKTASTQVAIEEPPPTAPDGTPRLVPSEDLPVLFTPVQHSTVKPWASDDMHLLSQKRTEAAMVPEELIVASENLKRKCLIPENAMSPADSYARQLAAEELAEELGLDADVEFISLMRNEHGKDEPTEIRENLIGFSHQESRREAIPSPAMTSDLDKKINDLDYNIPEVSEPLIEPIEKESRVDTSPIFVRTGDSEVSESYRLLEESGDELRVPSTENLDEGAFQDAYLAEWQNQSPPSYPGQLSGSPVGLAGHDMIQSRPDEGYLVEETEEVLPDGTVVKTHIKTSEIAQTISAHDWEEAAALAATDAERFISDAPEETVNVEEVECVLEDGTVVKKLITTQRIVERITEHDVSDEVSEAEVPDAGPLLFDPAQPHL